MALARGDENGCLPVGKTPNFDIFAGHFGSTDILWIETVKGLADARSRMEEIAAQKPGPYFVFFAADHKVLAAVDAQGAA